MTVTSYTLGDSAYNSIKHLWAPISKWFTGVKANPCAEGDSVAPCLVLGCSKEDVKQEVEVFDRVIKEICEDYLDKLTFDDHPVAVRMIPCEEKQHQSFGKRQMIETFLKAPLHCIYGGHHKELQEQFKDLLTHVDQQKCEVTFMKCMNCRECCKNDVKAKKSMGFLKKHGNRHPEVMISHDLSH